MTSTIGTSSTGNIDEGTDVLSAVLHAALACRTLPTDPDPEANPYASHTVEQLRQGVGLRLDERHPAVNLVGSRADTSLAYEMEEQRFIGITDGKRDRSAKRAAAARQRRQRKEQFDAVLASPVVPTAERMADTWPIVAALAEVIEEVVKAKRAYADRLLGSVADDVLGSVYETVAMSIAKQTEHDLKDLRTAALQLGAYIERTRRLPGEQATRDERRDAKREARARKWLMGMVNRRVVHTVIDMYRRERNLRWENLDVLDTIEATINGPGADPMHAASKASIAPTMLGTRFPRPGGIDAGLLAMSINAAITAHGLDRLVEVLLANLRTDGAVPWTRIAEQVFLADPDDGEFLWSVVVQQTAHLPHPNRERGDKARLHARALFAWLPGFIHDVVLAHEIGCVGWSVTKHGSLPVMSSDFDGYVEHFTDAPTDALGTPRYPLAPALDFDSPSSAVRALVQHLGVVPFA